MPQTIYNIALKFKAFYLYQSENKSQLGIIKKALSVNLLA
jgi:hypothetical protein